MFISRIFFIVTQFPAAKIESQIEQNREWSSFVTSQRNNEQCNIRYVLWYPAVVSCDSCFNVCEYLVSNFLAGSYLFFFFSLQKQQQQQQQQCIY